MAFWRAHAWIMSRAGFIFAAIVLIGSIPVAFTSVSWGAWVLIFFIFVAVVYLILQIYLYVNTIYILTDERVLAINQSRFLVRKINEVPLVNIQNVAHTRQGLFQMLLDYGDVDIQTAGSTTAMNIQNVPHPYLVQQKILDKELKKG